MPMHKLIYAMPQWETIDYDFSGAGNPATTVLLITPQYKILNSMREWLEEGMTWCICAVDWVSGTADIMMRLITRKYSLLLIDLNIPDVIQTVSRIRTQVVSELAVPIVGFSTETLSQEERYRYVCAGIKTILSYPTSTPSLRDVLMDYVFTINDDPYADPQS